MKWHAPEDDSPYCQGLNVNVFMNDNSRALHSQYIISGTRMDVPPAVMLDAAQGKVSPPATEQFPDPVIDETIDPSPSSLETDDTRLSEYLTMVKERLISAVRYCPLSPYPGLRKFHDFDHLSERSGIKDGESCNGAVRG